MGVAVFGRAFLSTTGLARDADWYPIALGAWAVIWVLAARGVRPTTRSVLVFEVVSVCLILVLMGAIFWRMADGTAPGGQALSGDVFVLPPGVGVSALALAATAGFLAFAGFESAGSLGEESLVPTRMIPRAIRCLQRRMSSSPAWCSDGWRRADHHHRDSRLLREGGRRAGAGR